MPELSDEEWLAKRIKENTLGTGADQSKLSAFERQGVAMAKGALGNVATEYALPFMYNAVPESFLTQPRPEGGFKPTDFEREAAIADREGSTIAKGFGAASTIIPAAKMIGGLANAGRIPGIFGAPSLAGQTTNLATAGALKTAATDVLPDVVSGAGGATTPGEKVGEVAKGAGAEALGGPLGFLAQRIFDPAGLAIRNYGGPIAEDLVSKAKEFIRLGREHGETIPATTALQQATREVRGSPKEVSNAAGMGAKLETDLARAGAGPQAAAADIATRNQAARTAGQTEAQQEQAALLARTGARSEGRAGARLDMPDWAMTPEIAAAREAALKKLPQPVSGTRTDSPQAFEATATELREQIAAERNPLRLAQLQQAHQTLLEQIAEKTPFRGEAIPAGERLGDIDRLTAAQAFHPTPGKEPAATTTGDRLTRLGLGAASYSPAVGAMVYGHPFTGAATAAGVAGLQGGRALNRALEARALPEVIDRLLTQGGDVLSQVGRQTTPAIATNVAAAQGAQGAGGLLANFAPAQELLGAILSGLLPSGEKATEEKIKKRETSRRSQ